MKKVLFILSRDFGEISLATIFARNQSFKRVYAIPEYRMPIFDEPAEAIYPYTSITDLPKIIEQEKPDLISLNSGYLIIDGNLASRSEYSEFRRYLAKSDIPLLTTDPFVRIFDYFPDSKFEINGRPIEKVQEEIKYLSSRFSKIPHVYGFPFITDKVEAYTFYNDKYFTEEKADGDSETKRWLLVLAELDTLLLLDRHGKNFVPILEQRLMEICGNPKNMVNFVLPYKLGQALQANVRNLENLYITSFVPLGYFEKILRNSDIVLYWNVFSNSILLCYCYNIPLLFFDKGHIANLTEYTFDHISKYIYKGGKPEFIDFESPIDSDLDILLNNNFSYEKRSVILDNYKRLESPSNIVERLCQ